MLAKITLNVARSSEEAQRQARGENVAMVKDEGIELETYSPDEMFDTRGTGDQPDA